MFTIAFAAAWLLAASAAAGPAPQPPAAMAPADPSAADREAIRSRLREWVAAMITRDPAAMDRVMGADFQAVTYGGRLIDRAADIAAVTAPEGFRLQAVTTREVDIRVYGDAAVVRGSVSVMERRGDVVQSVPVRVTQTWIRQAGDWRLVADHATRIEPDAQAVSGAVAAQP